MLGKSTGSSRAKMTGMFIKVMKAVSIPKELLTFKKMANNPVRLSKHTTDLRSAWRSVSTGFLE